MQLSTKVAVRSNIRGPVGRADLTLLRWFGLATRPKYAYPMLAFAAIGYSVVAFELAAARALPMPEPYLRIADADYFFWAGFFYAPVIVGAWLLASGVAYLLTAALRIKSTFDELLAATAFATGMGTLGTLIPDLITSPLRALRVIDERAWESSISSHGVWYAFTWVTLVVYLLLFLVAYPLAVKHVTGATWAKAIPVGIVAFVVFQGFEYVFIR
jgi:hypothetical protein